MNNGMFGFPPPLLQSSNVINAVGASTITSSTSLTNASAGYQVVSMTSLGQSVTLPSAIQIDLGGPRYILRNSGGYPFGVRDNSGNLIIAVAPGGMVYMTLEANSSAAGTWSYEGINLEPGLITIDNTFSSTYAATVLAPFVALDNNTSIHFAALSSGFAAFVVDNTGKVVSTPVTVDSTASSAPKTVFKISATTAIVFYGPSATSNSAVVLSLSGSSPTYSISVGTPQTFATSMSQVWGGETFVNQPVVAQLSSTLYVASFTVSTTSVSVIAISVSGTTVTIGAKADIITTNVISALTTTYALTATTALVLYKSSAAAAPYANNAVVISVSGTTCTVGTPAALTGCQSSQTAAPASAFISATKIAVADDNNTTQVTVSGVTISGTTVTPWTALNVETGLSTNLIEYTTNSTTRYNPHLWLLSAGTSNTFGCWYLDGSSISRVAVITESSGTVTAGAISYNSISSAATNVAGFGQILPQGTTDFCSVVERAANTAGYQNYILPCKISGSAISQGTSKSIPVPPVAPTQVSVTRMSTGNYVLTGSFNSAVIPFVGLQVWTSNGDEIGYRGEITAPSLTLSGTGITNTAPMWNVSSSRVVVLGRPLSTSVGAATYQLRLLNVEIAQ